MWGKHDPDDGSLCVTARREMMEESGIPIADALSLLPDGTMPTLYASGGAVAVYVVSRQRRWAAFRSATTSTARGALIGRTTWRTARSEARKALATARRR